MKRRDFIKVASAIALASSSIKAEGCDSLISADGVGYSAVRPSNTTPRPLLITFATNMTDSLNTTFNGVGNLLLSAPNPWVVASMDLPCNGAYQFSGARSGLLGWYDLCVAGVDFVTPFIPRVQSVINDLRTRGYADPSKLMLMGISRGAFMALQLVQRGVANKVAALSPVTKLSALLEFSPALATEPMPLNPNAFVGKSVYLTISNRDIRVGTFNMTDFCTSAVLAHGTSPYVDINWNVESIPYVAGNYGHTWMKDSEKETAQWILKQTGEQLLP